MQADFQLRLKLATMLTHLLSSSLVAIVLMKQPFSALVKSQHGKVLVAFSAHMRPMRGTFSAILSIPPAIGNPLNNQTSFFLSSANVLSKSSTSAGTSKEVPCLMIPASFFLVHRVSSRSINKSRFELYLYSGKTREISNRATFSVVSIPRWCSM